jgi:two-component system LytT family sensor kinase
MQKLNDKWMRIIGIPVLALLGQWMMYGYTNMPYPDDPRIPLFFVIGTVIVWHVNRWGIILSRRKYPELAQTLQRILYQLMWFFFFSSVIRISQTFLYHLFNLWPSDDYMKFKPYFFNTLVSVIGTVQVAAYYEGVYLYQRWKVSYTETVDLKKASLQSQLNSLKTQINPHFLFNNLNTLSSLITIDSVLAERFVDQISSVYRYLLHQNTRDLCALKEEIQFIDAYFHLLKTRFGSGIFMEKNIEPKYLAYLIPPLTLQLLFENAIKHNVTSENRPLTIRLYTKNDFLYIENNMQKKKTAVQSNQIGLQNIMMKYKLLDQPAVDIYADDEKFLVCIPLIFSNPGFK